MEHNFEEQANILKALGHPTRLRIVKGICENGCNVSRMVEGLGMPQATVSQHLGVLRASGIIKGEKRGLEICYRIINEKVKKILEVMASDS
ncbi:MAG: transcriptional regulator [Candidatus Margulisiibacteriota bacterium]|nr:MAG: transcriptional regulator [Candidatus Margulisbacteria bacterium GWD2_39_127]OGI05579.1 MAG: transcriptional regulator [Candidatus Margulisbacteria bacterium GWF2_38_17]OGI07536.1 MAG: transcriptional regulator [Candidatus Margulisbacteria bacterium GWE2_39_32]PZM84895.1 MAG: transcriptional regulator [Candidatus Margulisiibacteriota bacterium]HAR64019.1 transcriptional regulator [Candidatus Margulisiibacteriota bacterium]